MADAVRLRILVIEDSPTLLALMHAVLREAGHVVLSPGGRSAAATLREDRPDLVFLAGWETADEFFAAQNAEDALKTIPVVALGLPQIAADGRPRPVEIVDVLPKPFSPDALLAAVEHVRVQRANEAAARARAEESDATANT
ncbi:MAG TPA: response regulator, partial [Polyangia bacterium]